MRKGRALSVLASLALGALASCSSEPRSGESTLTTGFSQTAFVPIYSTNTLGDAMHPRGRVGYGGEGELGVQWGAAPRQPQGFALPGKFSNGVSGAPRLELAGVEAAHRLATSSETRTKSPTLLARIAKPDLEELPLEALRVATVLTVTRARTLVDMTFANDSDRQLEGALMVRLPDGASPCYLGVFQGSGPASKALQDPSSLLAPALDDPALLLQGDPKLTTTAEWGQLRPAHVVEAEQGAQVYESVTRQRIDPALMEWSGGNTFKTRIFPIAAKGRKRVALIYDQPPLGAGDRVLVPLAVPEKLPNRFRVEVAVATSNFSDGTLMTGDVETKLDGSGTFLRTSTASAPAGVGLVLAATPRGSTVSASFGTADGVPGALVHARLSPKLALGEKTPTGSAVFLLDTSLSQRTTLAPLCGQLLREVLDRDSTIERYQVIGFDVAARPLTAGWRANTPANREETCGAIESIWLEGATNMAAAIEAAEKALAPGEHATFFLLSDAIASWGAEDPRELARAYPRAFAERWIAYSFGDQPMNHALVEELTRSNGRIVHVLGSDSIETAALAHASPAIRLRGVHVAGVTANHLVVAGSPAQLFPGEVVEVAFRTSEDPRKATIVLEGVQSLSLAEAHGPDAVSARAWAELTTTGLLELRDEDADRAAVALSQRFALANRVASFLMLETDGEYATRAIKTETLELDAVVAAARGRLDGRPSFAPRTDALDEKALAFLESAKRAKCAPWPTHDQPAPRAESFGKTSWPEHLDATAVHREAVRRFEGGRADEALRVLSSIVEESPRDGPALRLTAFTLMGWERFPDAERLFARSREVRPFEPQPYLGEALALEAQGRLADAALRYEIVLAGKFDPRYDLYAKESARRLYGRLLARAKGLPEAAERSRVLDLKPGARHELVLFWNLDDTDIDLHVIEEDGSEVDYQKMHSKSGGELLWDNTRGLGPEIYCHAELEPRAAFVHFYGSQSISGRAPAATLVVAFDGREVHCRSSVLPDARAKTTVFERTRSP